MKIKPRQIILSSEIINNENTIVSSASIFANIIGATSTEETLKNHEYRVDIAETTISTLSGLINNNLLAMKVLSTDVVNSNATANTLADISDLSFSVVANKTYYFKAIINYTAAATTTGSRWTINGPTATMSYKSVYTLTATTLTTNYSSAYDFPALSNASSLAAGNVAEIEGFITPSANGTVVVRFASEIANSAITAKKGSVLFYKEVV